MSEAEWNLYPEIDPPSMANYLVTFTDKENKKRVTVGYHLGSRWYYTHGNTMELIRSVVAWAELPKPYVGKEVPVTDKPQKEWWED